MCVLPGEGQGVDLQGGVVHPNIRDIVEKKKILKCLSEDAHSSQRGPWVKSPSEDQHSSQSVVGKNILLEHSPLPNVGRFHFLNSVLIFLKP